MLRTGFDCLRRVVLPAGACRGFAVWGLLLCVLSPPPARAGHQPDPQETAAARPGIISIGAVRLEIPDIEVLDQDGRKVRFYSELIQGKVVVVSLFFTSCKLICPMQNRALARLQDGLAGRLGEDVFFISVSKDPATDTPERLKGLGAQYGAGRGWTLVTGAEDVMGELLRNLSGDGPGRQMHDPILLVGNDRTGVWREAYSLAATGELIELIDQLAGRSVTKGK